MSTQKEVVRKSIRHMVWLDLEMTGLDPKRDTIIEIATVITDGDLNVLAIGPNLAIHHTENALKRMDRWNQRCHRRSGLIELVRCSKTSIQQAEALTLNFVKSYCFKGKSPLCGNAIHHDRRFLIDYMPKLNNYLHYRHVDVSTIKDIVARWYPKDRRMPKKSERHRALEDTLESIQELRYYKETFFKQAQRSP